MTIAPSACLASPSSLRRCGPHRGTENVSNGTPSLPACSPSLSLLFLYFGQKLDVCMSQTDRETVDTRENRPLMTVIKMTSLALYPVWPEIYSALPTKEQHSSPLPQSQSLAGSLWACFRPSSFSLHWYRSSSIGECSNGSLANLPSSSSGRCACPEPKLSLLLLLHSSGKESQQCSSSLSLPT